MPSLESPEARANSGTMSTARHRGIEIVASNASPAWAYEVTRRRSRVARGAQQDHRVIRASAWTRTGRCIQLAERRMSARRSEWGAAPQDQSGPGPISRHASFFNKP
jgi:hypothetical protein